MGRALVFFRQATADAATTRRKEGEQTRTLESRRQLVETATREFERAVYFPAHVFDLHTNYLAASITPPSNCGL